MAKIMHSSKHKTANLYGINIQKQHIILLLHFINYIHTSFNFFFLIEFNKFYKIFFCCFLFQTQFKMISNFAKFFGKYVNNSKMSSTKPKIIKRNLNGYTHMKLIGLNYETPTIRSLKLTPIINNECNSIMFEPGQWVDFYVDNIGTNKIGGYSITSIPDELIDNQYISLAIKRDSKDKHLVTNYVHGNDIKIGNEHIWVKVGGKFKFNEDIRKHLICIAGGIGITPVASIFKQYCCKYCKKGRITLIYSVKQPNEFALLDELKKYQQMNDKRASIVTTVTGIKSNQNMESKDNIDIESKNDDNNVKWNGNIGRINGDMIKKCVKEYENEYNLNECVFILCGPTTMIDSLNDCLIKEIKVNKSQIFFEKWW